MGYQGPSMLQLHKSHPSALAAPEILTKDLQDQQANDRLSKLATEPSFPFVSSPLGLVPKGDGRWRRIHDLSFPRGSSVNDGIPKELGALEYASIDEAIESLLRAGKGATLVKRDLKDAFRHVPVASSDSWLLGFFCDGFYWVDRFLPFGLRTSPFLFDLFAKGLHWILIAVLGWSIILHYFAGADTELFGRQFDELCKDLGLSINDKKSLAGAIVEFLGIELDSLTMEARLPPDKLQRAKREVERVLKGKSVSRLELQKVVGFLCFAAKVVVPGRAFLRSSYDAIARHTPQVHINGDIRADLSWWLRFLEGWNGIRLLRLETERPIYYLWTDASGNVGLGASSGNPLKSRPPRKLSATPSPPGGGARTFNSRR